MKDQAGTGSRSRPDLGRLLRKIIARGVLVFVLLGAMFFLPAWTFHYWQAWVYLGVISIPMIVIVRYLYVHDPALLERRMRMKERQKAQRLVIAGTWLQFLASFGLPGFDHRLGWSHMPVACIIVADILVFLGYMIVAAVFRANTYASRVVEVEKGQRVITTGPYAVVRHPMYAGLLIFYLFSSLALGSWWAAIPASLIAPFLMIRIKHEEAEMMSGLEGYREYTQKTRFRLVPGIW